MIDEVNKNLTKLRKTAKRYRRDRSESNWEEAREEYQMTLAALRKEFHDMFNHMIANEIITQHSPPLKT